MRLLLPLLGLLGAALARPNYPSYSSGYGQAAFGGNTRNWGNQGNTRSWGNQGNTRAWGQGNTRSWGQQGNSRPWGGQSASAWSEWTAVSVNQPFLRGHSSHSTHSGHIGPSQSSTGHSGHSSGMEYSIDSQRQLQGVQQAQSQGLFRGTVGWAQSTANIEVLAAGHSAPTGHAVIITDPNGGQGYNPGTGGQDITILPGNLGEGWALPPVEPGVQPAPLPLQARAPAPSPCSTALRPSPCGSSCGRGAWGRPCAAGCSSPCARPLAPARPLPMPLPLPMPSPCQAAPQMGPLLGPIATTGCGRANRWGAAPAPRPAGCSTGGCGK